MKYLIIVTLFLTGCSLYKPDYRKPRTVEISKSRSLEKMELKGIDENASFTSKENLNFEMIELTISRFDRRSFPSLEAIIGLGFIRTSNDHSNKLTGEGVSVSAGLGFYFTEYFKLQGTGRTAKKFTTIITDEGSPSKNRYDASLNSSEASIVGRIPFNFIGKIPLLSWFLGSLRHADFRDWRLVLKMSQSNSSLCAVSCINNIKSKYNSVGISVNYK